MNFDIATAKKIAADAVNNTSLDIKSGACLVSVKVQGSCGQSTLPKSKTIIDGASLDSDLVKGTALQWFPKEELRFSNRILQQVTRLLGSCGVSYGKGMTLVPLASLVDLKHDLNSLENEFDAELQTLCGRYQEIIRQHQIKNPDVAELIGRHALTEGEFKSRFIFRVMPPMAMSPLFEEDEGAVVADVVSTLWDEVAEDAAKLHKNSFARKEKVSQKAVSAIKKLRRKLANLGFLEPKIDTVVDAFDKALAALPKTGYIVEESLHKLGHFVLQAANVDTLKSMAGIGSLPSEEEEDNENADLVSDFEGSMSTTTVVTDSKPEVEEVEAITDADIEGVMSTTTVITDSKPEVEEVKTITNADINEVFESVVPDEEIEALADTESFGDAFIASTVAVEDQFAGFGNF
jgi:hypothetical protein